MDVTCGNRFSKCEAGHDDFKGDSLRESEEILHYFPKGEQINPGGI